MAQLVDTLQGLLPRQGSQRNVEQLVDIPVLGDGPDCGDLPGFHPGQCSTARRGARARGRGAQRSVPGQGSTASRGRRFVGHVLVVHDADGRDGWIEFLSAQAELSSGGVFRFLASYWGRFVAGADVWFSARELPTGRWEAFDLVER